MFTISPKPAGSLDFSIQVENERDYWRRTTLNEAKQLNLIGISSKNFILASFNTKKYHLSIIQHQKSHLSIFFYHEIYEILLILTDYHLKSKKSLKRNDLRNII